MRVVVGLGNPGQRYVNTRHNLGFRVVEAFAATYEETWVKGDRYLFALINSESDPLLLVKPSTFMNSSGEAVADVILRFSPSIDDLMVVVDDVHLSLGQNRIRRRGSDGGHNGLTSIQASLESSCFPRLRMGVGSPPEGSDLIDYVLGEFASDELVVVDAQIKRAVEAMECWVDRGLEEAMNYFNCEG